MRIGLVELLLILLIASLTIGPSAALWVDRWMRRAQKTSAAAARRRAAQEGIKYIIWNSTMAPCKYKKIIQCT